MAEHVRVLPGNPYPAASGQPPRAPGGGVAVHPGAVAVDQDRPASPYACRVVDTPADRAGRRCSRFETLTDGRDRRDVTGGDDSSGERGKSVEQLLELLVVQAVVGGEGRAVGAILDVVAHVLAPGRELAVSADELAIDESGGHAVPFGVVVVPGCLEYLARDDASCCLKDVRFTAAYSGGGQSCDMPVASVLAQQRAGLPQGGSRFRRPRQCPVGGEQGAALHRRRLCSGARENGCHLHCLGEISAGERPPQRRCRASLTLLERRAGRGEGPGVRYGPADVRDGEVVEGGEHDLGADRAHGRGPAGEVTHPEALVPCAGQGGADLWREVGNDVD